MLYNLHQCLKKKKERKRDSTSANQTSIPSKMADYVYLLLKFCHLLQTYAVAFLGLQQVQSCGLLLDSQNVNLSCKQEMAVLHIGLESFKI